MFLSIPSQPGAAKSLLAALVWVLTFLASAPVSAQSVPEFSNPEEVYTVRNVAVDEKDSTASAAREIALRAARRMAFSRLTRRIVLPQDLARLPLPSDDALANLVTDFEVAGEKTSAKRYMASLTLRFDPDNVRALLRRGNARHSETGAEAVLVLPVYDGQLGRLLWEANGWRDGLGAAITQTGAADDRLAPLVLPLGDFEDVSAVNADQAVAGDRQRLDVVVKRYGAADILLIHAIESQIPGAGSGTAIDVTLRRPGTPEENLQIERFEAGAGETPDLLLRRAAMSLVRGIEEAWLMETALDYALPASLEVMAPLGALQDWLGVQRRLRETPMIQRVDLMALSVRGAQVNLHYLGTQEKLAAALSQHGLALTQEAGRWQLK